MNEETRHQWLKIGAIGIITFIAAFLAFYILMEIILSRMADPVYNAKRVEKMIRHQQKDFKRIENKVLSDNPFEPRLRPMLVNLVKETNELTLNMDLDEKSLFMKEKLILVLKD